MRVNFVLGIPIAPSQYWGLSLYVGVGLNNALDRQRKMPSGLEIYLLPLATFMPSVTVSLCMVQLFQKRELSRGQHDRMHWAELLQVIKTIVTHGPSVCMICLNLHRVTFLLFLLNVSLTAVPDYLLKKLLPAK